VGVETAAAGFRLRCGAVWLLSMDGTDEEANTDAATGMRGLACVSFTIRHICALEGRDLGQSAMILGFCGWGLWNKTTTSTAKKEGANSS